METGLENLHISSNKADQSLQQFLDILDVTKKRKQVIKILKEEESNNEFFSLLEKWLQQKLLFCDITIIKKISTLLEVSTATRLVAKKTFLLSCSR